MRALASATRVLVTSCALAVGCSEPAKTKPDAAPPDGPTSNIDAPNVLGRFNPPQPVGEIDDPTYGEDDPTITGDGLELYYQTSKPGDPAGGGADIWFTTRTSNVTPWGTPTHVPNINSAFTDANPEISADGLTLWLISDRTDPNTDIYVSTRASRSQPWSTPVAVTELNSTANDRNMRVTPSSLVMYFTSTRAGGTSMLDVYRATRPSATSPWDAPVLVTELSTDEGEGHPSPSFNETLFVFSRVTGGSQQLFEVIRTSGTFGTPRALDELNTATGQEGDPELSEDGRSLVFSRTGLIMTARR